MSDIYEPQEPPDRSRYFEKRYSVTEYVAAFEDLLHHSVGKVRVYGYFLWAVPGADVYVTGDGNSPDGDPASGGAYEPRRSVDDRRQGFNHLYLVPPFEGVPVSFGPEIDDNPLPPPFNGGPPSNEVKSVKIDPFRSVRLDRRHLDAELVRAGIMHHTEGYYFYCLPMEVEGSPVRLPYGSPVGSPGLGEILRVVIPKHREKRQGHTHWRRIIPRTELLFGIAGESRDT